MAQEHIKLGNWQKWLAENFNGSHVWASVYMRAAFYKDRLRLDTPVNEARKQLRGLPPVGLHGIHTTKAERAEEIRRLCAQGLMQKEVAEIVGVPPRTVWAALNPEKRRAMERRWEQKRATERKAARQREREQVVRAAGGSVAEAYGLIRKALQALERAAEREQSRDAKLAIEAATHRLYGAEDEVVKASKLSTPERAAA